MHETRATVVRLLPFSASSTAVTKPMTVELTLAVAVKISGIVLAVSTA